MSAVAGQHLDPDAPKARSTRRHQLAFVACYERFRAKGDSGGDMKQVQGPDTQGRRMVLAQFIGLG